MKKSLIFALLSLLFSIIANFSAGWENSIILYFLVALLIICGITAFVLGIREVKVSKSGQSIFSITLGAITGILLPLSWILLILYIFTIGGAH